LFFNRLERTRTKPSVFPAEKNKPQPKQTNAGIVMKFSTNNKYPVASRCLCVLFALSVLTLAGTSAYASVAYGTINNFDTVNDTGEICNGFEIELDDIHSQDITYCYSYNHYGTPDIREDTFSVPGHTNVFVRYAAILTNGVWSGYTAIPTNPIAPTLGHQFTNPSLNFGGEHFGVGFYGNPTAIKYNWLLDDGFGNLVHGPAVLVSTPVFTYYPPAPGVPAAVQAVVEPPQVEVQPVEGFGPASWIKSIKTAAHTNIVIQLRQLVSDDPGYTNNVTWRNGENSQVESEFDLLQQEFGTSGGHHGSGAPAVLAVTNAPEAVPVGDEIVTRRYEFYAYAGPTDPTTHAALAKKVGPDGIHGVNQYSNTVVVGEYLGAQMSAYKNELPIGLTENIADGQINTVYPTRTIVIAGIPFACTNTGTLPTGMTLNLTTGQLAGTPTESGVYTFTVRVSGTNQPAQEHAYTFAIADANEVLPPHSTVDTVSYPLDSGNVGGLGLYTNGDSCTVQASAKPGYRFSNWTDNDTLVSSNVTYQFPVTLNHSLVAHFISAPPNLRISRISANTHALEWPTSPTPCVLEETLDFHSTNWSVVNAPVSVVGTNAHVEVPAQPGARFYRLRL
jgi:Putative Ig domain/Divergent InlB B-repeat domain